MFTRKIKLISITVAWLILLWSGGFVPRLEGYYFPVVSNMQIDTAIAHRPSVIQISGHFDTIRDNCELIGIEWYDRRGIEERQAFFGEDQTYFWNDDQGRIFFGPITLTSSDISIIWNPDSELLLRHRCHPLWDTVTSISEKEEGA